MNDKKLTPHILFCLVGLLLIFSCTVSFGASLHFEVEKEGSPGQIQLVADQVEKLAGLKITITYDKKLLAFEKAEKSAATSSFMHVVNDKIPGKVIIVMASATGISGENIPLFHLSLSGKEATSVAATKISVIQVQLMDETLKEIVANKPEYNFPTKIP